MIIDKGTVITPPYDFGGGNRPRITMQRKFMGLCICNAKIIDTNTQTTYFQHIHNFIMHQIFWGK